MCIRDRTVLAREDHAKEVKLFGLGPRLLQRYRDIFARLYREDRALSVRRDSWGFVLGLLGTATLYAAYVWTVLKAVAGAISLGSMTMYLLLFRQGQQAVSAILSAIGGMYEDNLYLSTLYDYLDTTSFYSAPVAFAFPPAFMKEARLRVAAEWAESDLIAVRDLLGRGLLSFDGLISHRAPASAASGAYETAFSDPHCLKMILEWRDSQ